MENKILSTDEYAIAENNRLKQIEELENTSFEHWPNYLLLKWWWLKQYDYLWNEEAVCLIKELYDLWISQSAIMQKNTDKHKEILCKLVDITDWYIVNDWDWDLYTKEQAKEYILNYNN